MKRALRAVHLCINIVLRLAKACRVRMMNENWSARVRGASSDGKIPRLRLQTVAASCIFGEST